MSLALTRVVALRQRGGDRILRGWVPNREAGVSRWGYLVLLPWQRGTGDPVGRGLGDGVPALVEGGVTRVGGFGERGLVIIRRRRRRRHCR